MKYTNKEYLFMVQIIDKRLYDLTKWEQEFYRSTKARILAGVPLSDKQAEVFGRIWDKVGI